MAQRRGPKPFTFGTYIGPVHAWTWWSAATQARQIAVARQAKGDPAESVVTEKATGRTWTITPDSDLVQLDPEGTKP